MKRSTLLLICLLVFVALVGGAAAWMYFSPGGALAPVTAEDAVQELLDTTDTAEWRAKYVSLCAPETSVLKMPRPSPETSSTPPYRGESFPSGGTVKTLREMRRSIFSQPEKTIFCG